MHCQRDHVAYLADRGAHWILTVKGNQPILHQQVAGLLWRQTPEADRDTDRGHGRQEIRTLKILSIAAGIEFPHAAQAIQIRRRRRRLDEPRRFTTETVYAITDLQAHQARPWQLTDWIRGHWSIGSGCSFGWPSGSSFERSGPSAGMAAGLGVHTHGLGRSGRQTVTTTFPRVWPAPT